MNARSQGTFEELHGGFAKPKPGQDPLTPAAQAMGAQANAFQMPSNKSTPVPPQAPKLSEIKLIDFDFVKYGSSAERRRLLSKWDREVKNLPK